MNRGKFFRRTLLTLLTVSIMLFSSVTHAEIYTGEGSYIMSEGENLGVAKERAKADAMRNATEKAGVYVRNYTRTRNLMLEEDIIETMTSNIIKLVENPHFYPLETVDNLEGVLIRVTVKAQIDDSDINRWLNKNEQEKSMLVSQMDALRKANEEQARQIAELKRQLANNPQNIEQITKKFAKEDKIFLSNQKLEEAVKFDNKGDYNGVIKLCNEALELNPQNLSAYFDRGTAYSNLGQYERAIKDFNKVIQLNPNNGMAYYKRGIAYFYLKQKENSIQDYSKAIQLNPNDYYSYYNRAVVYRDLKQYEKAIQDYSKVIQLNPNNYYAYYNRGGTYSASGQYERSIKDFEKAIELYPNNSHAYHDRGWAYYCLKQYEKALKDFYKQLNLDSNSQSAKNAIELCQKVMNK